MDDLSQDELLSAYLDGEVTEGERELVQRWLAESPEARQTLDELHALSAAVRSLPKAVVGEDLAEEVIRLAQQRMLTTAPRGDEEVVQPAVTVKAIVRRVLSPRNLSWSIAAITVAMVVTMLNPQNPLPGPAKDPAAGISENAASVAVVPGAQPSHDATAPAPVPADEQDPATWAAEEVLVVECVCTTPEQAAEIARMLEELRIDARIVESPSADSPLAGQIQGGLNNVRELVYADATDNQLEAALAQLTAKPGLVAGLTVHPAPAVAAQESWVRFNRHDDRHSSVMIAADNAPAHPAEIRDPQREAEAAAGVVHADAPTEPTPAPTPSGGNASLRIRVGDRDVRSATPTPAVAPAPGAEPPKVRAEQPAPAGPTSSASPAIRPRYRALFIVRVVSGE